MTRFSAYKNNFSSIKVQNYNFLSTTISSTDVSEIKCSWHLEMRNSVWIYLASTHFSKTSMDKKLYNVYTV